MAKLMINELMGEIKASDASAAPAAANDEQKMQAGEDSNEKV